jgi:hypothetical protein
MIRIFDSFLGSLMVPIIPIAYVLPCCESGWQDFEVVRITLFLECN